MSRKTFLVGGAIRDELLGLPVVERDWVVTGATPQELLKEGYTQVGGSFPVFLHPKSRDEVALARTERKQGHGYHGFSVDFHPDVTIEEDLERRDLTVNAMARDDAGVLVDPYGGQRDLKDRVLRHVSPAFAEDPLRVLRVARFAARFAPQGFTVHADTLELMREMTAAGEIDHLVPERSWREIHRAMGSARPSTFIRVLRDCGALRVLLPEVDALYGVPQNEKWHPEIDTGIHVEMAMDIAAGAHPDVIFAVLLHDLGKGLTPQAEWPSHKQHEQTGLPLVDAVCKRFRVPGAAHKLARQVCKNHLRCHRLPEMRPVRVMALLEDLDAFRSRDVESFSAACRADYLGRKGRADAPYPQAEMLASALNAALQVQVSDLDLADTVTGPAVGEALRSARIKALANQAINISE